MLYQPNISYVTSINHGSIPKKIAREQMIKIIFRASPDGIIENENTLVKIKCPIASYKLGIDEAIKQGKMHFWKVDKKTGQIYVNKNSDRFIQVQGQLHISNIPKCILAAWYGDQKLKIKVIEKDDDFWRNRMEPHLSNFYFDCLLPELLDPRFTRGRRC